MKRHVTVFVGLALALALTRPGFAQDKDAADKCAGGAAGDKCGAALDLRVQLDKEDAKGEFKCKKGVVKGKKVVYAKCVHDKLDAYGEMAYKKKIIKKKPGELDEKKRKLAKKLAFYDSARKELKAKLAGLKDKPEDIEYKKAEGALEKVDKEFDKSLGECSKQDAADFTCPTKD
ncbi:hypothetical protein EPO15_15695 [bacterium]|nr:MAG: hypothetical protein EPO15_15695 [bacterium]